MKLQQEDRNALVILRFQRAKETIFETKGNMQLGYWRIAANRLYYACYYAASALLIKHQITTHSHAGVLNQLGLYFVSKGIINNEIGKTIKQLFNLRQTGDYDDWVVITEDKIAPLIAPAEEFINEMEKLINNP